MIVSSLISHRFQPFICCLSVVLWLDKGDFPGNLHTVCVRVKINKRSFELLCVCVGGEGGGGWILYASSHSVSDYFFLHGDILASLMPLYFTDTF